MSLKVFITAAVTVAATFGLLPEPVVLMIKQILDLFQ